MCNGAKVKGVVAEYAGAWALDEIPQGYAAAADDDAGSVSPRANIGQVPQGQIKSILI